MLAFNRRSGVTPASYGDRQRADDFMCAIATHLMSAPTTYVPKKKEWPMATWKTRYSGEDEKELILLAQSGDVDARNRLLTSNYLFIKHIIKRHFGRTKHVELEDLEAEGTVGFIRAIESFDVTRGLRLSTYASYWIRSYVGRFLERDMRPVLDSDGRFILSLDAPAQASSEDSADMALADVVADVNQDVHAVADTTIMKEKVREALSSFMKKYIDVPTPPAGLRNRKVVMVCLDRLLGSEQTYSQCGDASGVSREAVRQTEAVVARYLRKEMALLGVHSDEDDAIG